LKEVSMAGDWMKSQFTKQGALFFGGEKPEQVICLNELNRDLPVLT
jgi:hypothetical protein